MPKQTSNSSTAVSPLQIEDLTLDVCVLMSGSGISDDDTCSRYKGMCLELMKRMMAAKGFYLVLDARKKIEIQYESKLRFDTFGHFFVKQMVSQNKVARVPWTDINKGVKVKLECRGFTRDNEDYKFVVASSSSSSKKLITHEAHFFAVRHILKSVPVRVLLPSEA